MDNLYFAAVVIVVGAVAFGPVVLEIKQHVSTRVARKDSR